MSRSGCPAWATLEELVAGKACSGWKFLLSKGLSTALASQIESRAAARLLVSS
jgi:hypothetical protein